MADPAFWAGRKVCVTGGAGFLGFHIVRQLHALGARVCILGLRPIANHPVWDLEEVEIHLGDIRDPQTVRTAVAGASVIFHTAGTVAAWGPGIARMMEVHRDGTRNVLEAADREARIVHTSSVVTIGATRHAEVFDEDSVFGLDQLEVPYIHAKRAAEQIALEAAGKRDVVVVNPGYLLGPDDHEYSVMGRLCVRAWKGRVPLAAPGGFNLVDVRDVATGHLLAAERGVSGRRYILGGENHSQRDFLERLASAGGFHPRLLWTAPAWFLFTAAHLAELRARYVGKEPYPSLAQARLSVYHWYYRTDRARAELGYQTRELDQTLEDTLAWHQHAIDLRPRGLNAWLLGAKGRPARTERVAG